MRIVGYDFLGRPVTEDELRQLERERAERLDPANRPANAEVDNSHREWDHDLNDFVDSIAARPAGYVEPKRHVPFIERPAFFRILGSGLVLVVAMAMLLSWALFTKTFTPYDDVTLTAEKAGLSLPRNADVKLRGMIVGVVRDTRPTRGGVEFTLGMDPDMIGRVPRSIRAEIVPKTLFGEKYISLVPVGTDFTDHLKAGDTIRNAVVPVELETFFNDVYPLLSAVPPDKLAVTLTAVARTLDGRGDQLGATLQQANDYLRKLTPEMDRLVADIAAAGTAADAYSGQMSEVGALLTNSARVSRQVKDDEDELGDLVGETRSLADVARLLVTATAPDISATAHQSRRPIETGAEYSSVLPCLLRGTDYFNRRYTDGVYANGGLHMDLEIISPQPSPYPSDQRPVIPTEATVESLEITQPEIHGYTADGRPRGLGTICDELNAAAAGHPPNSHAKPLRLPDGIWQLL